MFLTTHHNFESLNELFKETFCLVTILKFVKQYQAVLKPAESSNNPKLPFLHFCHQLQRFPRQAVYIFFSFVVDMDTA